MDKKSRVAVRLDDKGRVTLPKYIRTALGVESGDTVLLFYEPKTNFLRLARVQDPFDGLAEHAIDEYKEGRTRSLDDYAREHNISLDEQ